MTEPEVTPHDTAAQSAPEKRTAADGGEVVTDEAGRTGEPRVDSALERLAAVEGAPLVDHVAAYDEVHRLLQDALADVDEG